MGNVHTLNDTNKGYTRKNIAVIGTSIFCHRCDELHIAHYNFGLCYLRILIFNICICDHIIDLRNEN